MFIVGITGSISAFKGLEIARLLQNKGLDVALILSADAEKFLTPMMAQAFLKKQIYRAQDLFHAQNPMLHIQLARQAQHILIAPASAHFMAKLACGFSDCLLSAVCLASRSPLTLAPAMNTVMWENAATQTHVQTLQQRGVDVLPVASGLLACGEEGPGRLLEPQCVVQAVLKECKTPPPILLGKKVVVTAGPTREYLDPIRFISNKSSGKMGYALAQEAYDLGAQTTLISGPTSLTPPSGVAFHSVTSSQDMITAVEMYRDMDIFISAAAICDIKPFCAQTQKIEKKNLGYLDFELTLDLLKHVGAWPKRPFIVGFCAQTDDILNKALLKFQAKGTDVMIANDATLALESDDNEGWFLSSQETIYLKRSSKKNMARLIMGHIARLLPAL